MAPCSESFSRPATARQSPSDDPRRRLSSDCHRGSLIQHISRPFKRRGLASKREASSRSFFPMPSGPNSWFRSCRVRPRRLAGAPQVRLRVSDVQRVEYRPRAVRFPEPEPISMSAAGRPSRCRSTRMSGLVCAPRGDSRGANSIFGQGGLVHSRSVERGQ